MYTCNFSLIIILWTWSTLYFRTCLTDSINDIMTPHIRRHNLKHLKAERIYAIREDILAKLGYDENNMPDKRKFDSHVLRQRLRDYRKQLIERNHTHVLFSEKEFAAKTYHKIPLSNSTTGAGSALQLRFDPDLSHVDDPHWETHIHDATLKLSHSTSTNEAIKSERRRVIMDIYVVTSSNRQPLASAIVDLDALDDVVKFDIKTELQNWLDRPNKESFKLELTSDLSNWQTHLKIDDVYIETFTQQLRVLRVRRVKRHLKHRLCKPGDGTDTCCRYPLSVSMNDLGLDWILSPPSFDAFICDGRCPRRHLSKHKFASIKALLHMRNPAASPRPCCSASKLSSLTITHYDSSGYIVDTILEDMVVRQCMCS